MNGHVDGERVDRSFKDPVLKIRIANEELVVPAEAQEHEALPLSNLDHYVPIMVKTLYVYEDPNFAGSKDVSVAQVLRDSLARALVVYHPVAGKIRENEDSGKLQVCYDEPGVPFVEAFADNDISDLGRFTVAGGTSWDGLIPDSSAYPGSKHGGIIGGPIFHVQITQFRTGGFTLGTSISHMIVDGISAGEFFSCWSSIARGITVLQTPNLSRSFLSPRADPHVEFGHLECFPLKDISNVHDLLHQGTFEYDSFSFNLAGIKKLQNTITKETESEPLLHKCTGFEAVAALAWKARTKSLQLKPAQMVKLVFSMSARPKLPKEYIKNYLGNLVLYPSLILKAGDVVQMSLSGIVRSIQEAKKSITLEYVQSAVDHYEITRAPPTHDDLTFCIAPWSWLGLNDGGNFGWGNPLYVGPSKPSPHSRELGAILLTSGSKEKGDLAHHLLLGLPSSAMESFSSLVSEYVSA